MTEPARPIPAPSNWWSGRSNRRRCRPLPWSPSGSRRTCAGRAMRSPPTARCAACTLTVICTAAVDGGTSAGTVSQEISDPAAVAAVVAAAERLARSGPAAEDAADPVADYPHSDRWDAAPETTGIEVLAELARALGEAFDRARAAEQLLFGFAEHVGEHELSRQQHRSAAPRRATHRTARAERQVGRPDRVGLGRASDPGLHRRGHRRVARRADRPARLGGEPDRAPPGRYETLLPPGAVADLLVYMYWTANARDAEEGRNVFAGPARAPRGSARRCPAADHPALDPHYPGLETMPVRRFAVSSERHLLGLRRRPAGRGDGLDRPTACSAS